MYARRRFRRGTRRRFFKRSFARKRRFGGKRRVFRRRYSPAAMGIPNSKIVKLRYVEWYTFNLSGVSSGVAVYRANGPYDPYAGTGGHQPLGYDQWAALYQHCVVLGSKCSVGFDAGFDSSARPLLVGVYLNDDTSTPATIASLLEDPKSRIAQVNCFSGAGKSRARVVHTYSAKRFFGLRDVKDNKYEIGSAVGTTPTEEAIYSIFCQLPAGTIGGAQTLIQAKVTIDYCIQFSERKDIDQS